MPRTAPNETPNFNDKRYRSASWGRLEAAIRQELRGGNGGRIEPYLFWAYDAGLSRGRRQKSTDPNAPDVNLVFGSGWIAPKED